MARPIWSGTVSFGLLNIPVQLYSGERSIDLHFRLLDSRDQNPVRYERINSETGEEVPKGNSKSYKVTPREMEMASQLLESMTAKWNPDDYKDEFRARIRKLIDERVSKKGKKPKRAAEEPAAPEATTNVVDFMSLLKRSLEKKGESKEEIRRRTRATHGTRRKASGAPAKRGRGSRRKVS